MSRTDPPRGLLVSPIKNGTVIDHITAGEALNVLKILGITGSTRECVSIATNVESKRLGKKDIVFYKGRGCQACQYTGYKGRIPVAELLEFDDNLRSLILEKPSTGTIKKFVTSRGMKTLLEDGLDKVVQGITTLDEVFRVVSFREAY